MYVDTFLFIIENSMLLSSSQAFCLENCFVLFCDFPLLLYHHIIIFFQNKYYCIINLNDSITVFTQFFLLIFSVFTSVSFQYGCLCVWINAVRFNSRKWTNNECLHAAEDSKASSHFVGITSSTAYFIIIIIVYIVVLF